MVAAHRLPKSFYCLVRSLSCSMALARLHRGLPANQLKLLVVVVKLRRELGQNGPRKVDHRGLAVRTQD